MSELVLVRWQSRQHYAIGGYAVVRDKDDEDLLPAAEAVSLEAAGLVEICGTAEDVPVLESVT